MTSHTPVQASDLRDGDLMRLGSSTNYVLVASTETVGYRVRVTIYDGDVPNEAGASLVLVPTEIVSLSMRDQRP